MSLNRLRLATTPTLSATLLLAGLGLLTAMLFGWQIVGDWPAPGDRLAGLILFYATLPRGAVALLAGAALGLAGALMQRVLRNPIADPSTLGVVSGAQLAMSAALLYAPGLMAVAREGVAFVGGALALFLVVALSWRRALDPITVVLSGMLISLIAAAFSATLILANGEYMMSMFIWGGGSLEQQSWAPTISLVIRFVLAAVVAGLLIRPLELLALDDANARALGLGVTGTRLAVLTLSVFLAASVTAEVGVIGFIGLAAPNLARMAGARTLRQILFLSPIAGALILLMTDGLVRLVSLGISQTVPTGAATALLGGPLLLWLLPRLGGSLRVTQQSVVLAARAASWRLLFPALLLLVLAACALFVGKNGEGWALATGHILDLVVPWRAPRFIAAAAAGAMLAAAGVLMQRITGNAMASPEVLGISSGAGVGLAAVLVFMPAASRLVELGGAAAGAVIAILLVIALSARHRFAAERLLLSGIAVGSLAGALVTVVMARGGPESLRLLNWLSGSTSRVSPEDAMTALAAAVLFIAPLPLLARWLQVLPLGLSFAQSVGLKRSLAASILVLIAALLSAASTLFVGPLSFVGLMAPHMARLAGFVRPIPQLIGAVLIGAALMVLADWMARTLAFPYQLPIGLVAALVGGPYLVWLLNRR
ncbi:Fe(3+)-hydroxamate ABC transporter permease FhuB [Tianweitania sp. BSSL-BM11]|uniref:Fe(3+)-hydroxamate ABC transporter permease FhuB n=1 Tax=Tianweitania aestuarii TaxID=2814886 RepID=A0ABS5S0W5_9HYPH|nr:Fe(3+)-hydroxamate ABC transporter permease FhuB [Tianweitania aestuarii]MBS9722099.1 Fe(3+)-hydroxamate ABC transporter permease FhuB [Tianweitania aestuarii]